MAITNGKLEGLVTIPTGNWAFNVIEATGPVNDDITLTAANTYYHSSAGNDTVDLSAKIQALLNASGTLNGTYTCTIGAGEGGTGKVTITETSAGVGNITLTWTSTALRDALGFTATKSGAATYTSTNAAKGLWLADGPHKTPYGDTDPGSDEADTTSTESPAGHVKSITYQRKVAQEIMWHSISRAKARIDGESTTGESFQQFHRDVILQEAAGFVGSKVKYYGDASTDATFLTYAIPGMREFRPEQLRDGWIERWRITLPRLVQVPS